ncbi:unnamed protein product [Cyprideis torosa]|uniref:Uncharacterized protein n=1 Tax=Cyprideis torosa TaxID=163714 RepID=A0A7R8WCJ3_9CRUS|nr:unnamed protein product [Cyprideis torosa]CAG0887581.1 unnamed protein product [Cyprideis torosa]
MTRSPQLLSKEGKEALAAVEKHKEEVKSQGERMVLEEFPMRILELNNLLADPRMSMTKVAEIHDDLGIPVPPPLKLSPSNSSDSSGPPSKRPRTTLEEGETAVNGTKVFLLTSGTVPSNRAIMDLLGELKPIITRLVDDANTLKMWISFLIPKIEDGNNFGVSIQEDTLAEIRAVESEAAAFYDQISRYYSSRGKIISKVAKYPHISDYRQTVRELDEKEFVSLRLVTKEVRNHYATLHDIITKNLEKIKLPRASHGISSMY